MAEDEILVSERQ